MAKKVRMKKKFWVLLTIIIITIVGLVIYKNYRDYINSPQYLLESKGYTEEQIKKVINNKKIVNVLLEKDYSEHIISIMNSKYYLDKNLDDYLEYKKKYNDTSYSDVIAIINVRANLDWYSDTKETDISKGNLMLVNKFHYLTEEYKVDDLVKMNLMYAFEGKQIKAEVYEAFKSMVNAAKKENLTLVANSTFRTYEYQEKTYNSIKNSKGKNYADNYAARPGFSEHQTGLAIDISTLNSTADSFEETEEFTWLQQHAHEYGFILRYPKDKEYLTGYSYESWHYRYVGTKIAKQIKKEGITFDEYYAYYME